MARLKQRQCLTTTFLFQMRSFDSCVSNYVCEHLRNPDTHLKEVWRVLRPGGTYVFRTPNRFHYTAIVSGLTPHSFHVKTANKLRDIDGHDPYPTWYRLNSRGQIRSLAHRANLTVEHLRLVEKEPSYGMSSRALFLTFTAYERLVNSATLFAPFRSSLFVVLRKRSPGLNSSVRILKVTQTYFPYLNMGGPPAKVRAIARALVARGHEVTVLTADRGEARDQRSEVRGQRAKRRRKSKGGRAKGRGGRAEGSRRKAEGRERRAEGRERGAKSKGGRTEIRGGRRMTTAWRRFTCPRGRTTGRPRSIPASCAFAPIASANTTWSISTVSTICSARWLAVTRPRAAARGSTRARGPS